METTTPTIELAALTPDDAVAASDLSDRVWRAYDAALGQPERPPHSDDEVARSRRRFAHQAQNDPDDSHAAWQGDRLVGVGLARRREAFWGLSLLIVDPDVQGQGVGRRLLDAALGSVEGAAVAMIASSRDPRAMARYRLAGFRLHPALRAGGRLDRSALPAVAGVRDGHDGDHPRIDTVGRQLRRGGYGPDLRLFAEDAHLLVVERGRRFAWAFVSGADVAQVGGTDEEVARDALVAGLASAEPEPGPAGDSQPEGDSEPGDSEPGAGDSQPGDDATVRHLTAEQDWAVEAVLSAGLRLDTSGPICLRGAAPPTPYVLNGMIF